MNGQEKSQSRSETNSESNTHSNEVSVEVEFKPSVGFAGFSVSGWGIKSGYKVCEDKASFRNLTQFLPGKVGEDHVSLDNFHHFLQKHESGDVQRVDHNNHGVHRQARTSSSASPTRDAVRISHDSFNGADTRGRETVREFGNFSRGHSLWSSFGCATKCVTLKALDNDVHIEA